MSATIAAPTSTDDAEPPLCSDCGCVVTNMRAEAIARGSTVREPGEPLCASCSAHRTKMVRDLNKIPDTLGQIRAQKKVEWRTERCY